MALVLVLALSLSVNTRGINWEKLHPDEHKIAVWMEETEDTPYIQTRVYPEGLFTSARLVRHFHKKINKIKNHCRQWMEQSPNKSAEKEYPQTITIIRQTNAWLVAFSAVFVLLMVHFATDNLAIAIISAILYLYHPFVVEHAHYAETDALMMFSGSAALCLITLALKKDNLVLFLISAFVSGFAVASKFTLAPIVFLMPINAIVIGIRKKWHWLSILTLAISSVLIFGAGFVLGTPKLYLNPSLFFQQAAQTKTGTYGEIRGLLGESIHRPHAALVFKIRCILNEATKCSWYWWAVCLLSIPLWFLKKYRKTFTGFPLFGLTYLIYAAFCFPWFRNQEFLPVLPFFAATAALPCLASFQLQKNKIALYSAFMASLIAVASVAYWTISNGTRMSSAFALTETRIAVSNWIDECGPDNVKYLFEGYVSSGAPFRMIRENNSNAINIKKLEGLHPEDFDNFNCEYFFRAASMPGRGNIDPKTNKLYPTRQQTLENILNKSTLLSSWEISSGIRPTFSQIDVELYANCNTNSRTLDISQSELPPMIIKSGQFGFSRYRISTNQGALGPIEAIGVVGKRTTIEFSPITKSEKYYAVAINLCGPSDIAVSWEKGFTPGKQPVPRGKAVLFESTEKLVSNRSVIPTSRVRMHGDDQTCTCVMIITQDRNLAAQILRTYGNNTSAQILSGDNRQQEKIHEAKKLLNGKEYSENLSINGIPSKVCDDFARFRSRDVSFSADLLTKDPRQTGKPGYQYAEMPFILGNNTVTLTLKFSTLTSFINTASQTPDILNQEKSFDILGADLVEIKPMRFDGTGNILVELVIRGRKKYTPFVLGIEEPIGNLPLQAKSICLRWHPADCIR